MDAPETHWWQSLRCVSHKLLRWQGVLQAEILVSERFSPAVDGMENRVKTFSAHFTIKSCFLYPSVLRLFA